MPHCIIEYSNGQDAELLCSAVFEAAQQSGLFNEDGSDIKVRASAFERYQTGGKRQSFIHVCLKILSGRTLEQRQALSQGVLENLAALATEVGSTSVEVVEMERASYSKRLA